MMADPIGSGSWVRSTAGSDRGTVYWVLRHDREGIWLVDGKRHRLTHPKKKNPKHVRVGEWEEVPFPTLPETVASVSRPEQLKWEAILRKTCRMLETKE